MRTCHESAMANLATANLPSKCRCHAVKRATRCYDCLPTKSNPEQFSRRAMRRTMMGMVTAMHQQMVPATPFGITSEKLHGKERNDARESTRNMRWTQRSKNDTHDMLRKRTRT